jgi:ATP/maltotriose-dependent transcriptional regulator MalT
MENLVALRSPSVTPNASDPNPIGTMRTSLKIEGDVDGNPHSAAKYRVMRVRGPAYTSRERLMRRLDAAAAHRITLVAAPAGCGKSVALRDYLQSIPHALFEVAGADVSLSRFARGLAEAMRNWSIDAFRTYGEASRGLLSMPERTEALARWFAPHAASIPCIAIDDFHIAANDPECSAFIVALIERTPDTRWIIASRALTGLPVSSWVVYGDAALPIEEHELHFTLDEARDAAACVSPMLCAADVEHAWKATGGWATALNLALRAASVSEDVQAAIATARKLSYQFLAEHVYASLPPDEKELLLFASVLPAIDVRVLEAAGFSRAGAMLADLRDRVTVLSEEEAQPRRYRCHDLFREFLVHQLELCGETAMSDALVKAADALESCGELVSALQALVRARAEDETLGFLHRHGFELGQLSYNDEVCGAIEMLGERCAEHPLVLALRGQRELAAGRSEDATTLLRRAHEKAEGGLRSAIALRLALVLFNVDDDGTVELIEGALDGPADEPTRGELLSLLAAARGKRGLFDGIYELMDRAELIALVTASDVTRMLMLQRIGLAAYYAGDVARAERACTRAAGIAGANGIFRVEALTHQTLSALRLMNGDDIRAALAASDRAVLAARRIVDVQPFFLRVTLAYHILLLSWLGDRERLAAAIDLYAMLPGHESMYEAMTVQRAKGILCAAHGDFSGAAQCFAEDRHERVFIESRILDQAIRGFFCALAGDRESALAATTDSLDAQERAQSPRPSVPRYCDMARALCGLTYALCGRASVAERILSKKMLSRSPVARALREAATAIVDRLDVGVSVQDVKGHLHVLEEHGCGGFAQALEAFLERHAAVPAKGGRPLTPAEIGVLSDLAKGRTPKQIAAANGSSVNTVRWHIRQAIAKFGCSGAAQAIQAARVRGLLPG